MIDNLIYFNDIDEYFNITDIGKNFLIYSNSNKRFDLILENLNTEKLLIINTEHNIDLSRYCFNSGGFNYSLYYNIFDEVDIDINDNDCLLIYPYLFKNIVISEEHISWYKSVNVGYIKYKCEIYHIKEEEIRKIKILKLTNGI